MSKILQYVWQTVWILIRCCALQHLIWVCKGLSVPILRIIMVYFHKHHKHCSLITLSVGTDRPVQIVKTQFRYCRKQCLIKACSVYHSSSNILDTSTGRSIVCCKFSVKYGKDLNCPNALGIYGNHYNITQHLNSCYN